MPKRKRDFDKRYWGHAQNNLDLAMSRVLALQLDFDRVLGLETMDPDYAEKIQALVPVQPHAKYALLLFTANQMILQAQQTLNDFALFAWGSLPDKIERWRNSGDDYRDSQEDGDNE
jgi:hypothetical protein